TGSLDLPAGRYEVVPHSGTSITARVSAGGEQFDARFAKDIRGTFVGNPRDLRAPFTADANVASAVVDTGITPRSPSARDYLQSDKHPRITFVLDKLVATRAESPTQIAYRATGKLEFVGKTHPIEIAGTLGRPDDAALARLGLTGAILLVQADFAIVIKDTALATDAGDFDGDRIPIHVSLVLRHTGG
ncbi:MAG TPA: YceI family protein, partial [Kofleriaceae bacterium]|nr:YceI family protein [Kofleriaceae bacterium]